MKKGKVSLFLLTKHDSLSVCSLVPHCISGHILNQTQLVYGNVKNGANVGHILSLVEKLGVGCCYLTCMLCMYNMYVCMMVVVVDTHVQEYNGSCMWLSCMVSPACSCALVTG